MAMRRRGTWELVGQLAPHTAGVGDWFSRNRHTSRGRAGGHADIARSGPQSRRINEVSLSGGFREDLLGSESLDYDHRAAAKRACPGAARRLRGSRE